MPRHDDRDSDLLSSVPAAAPADCTGSHSPLSEADFQALHRAVNAYRPVRAAARTAYISAGTILAVAAFSLVFMALSPGLTNLVITAALGIIGYLEYAGARKMKLGLPQAASHLGWNQIIFIALICIYCVGRMFDAGDYLSAESRSQLSSQLPEFGQQLDAIVPTAIRGFYLLVMVVSVVGQGLLARYYFTRRKQLETLRQTVPAWIRRIIDELA